MPVPIWAGRYIGLPFESHGRSRSGLDCWGLVRLALSEQFNVALPHYSAEYKSCTDAENISQLIERESQQWLAIAPGLEKTGDVAVLRMKGRPHHVGLVLGDRLMLHIEDGVDSAIESYSSPRWKDRIYGFYRYEPFDDTRYGF